MQKKIIALAIAAAFSAPAFADTNVYGIVDAAVARIAADGQKSDLLVVSGGLSSSRLGVKHTEDLEGGLKAVVVLEYALDTQTSDTVGAARQEMLAVAGGFGTVATGYLQTTGYDFGGKFDPVTGSTISPIQSVTKGGGFLIGAATVAARAPRAIAYISPDFNGLSFAVNYTSSFDNALGDLKTISTATTGLKTTAYLVSGSYTAGPLNAGLVYAGTDNASAGAATTTEYAVGASYDLGVVKLMGTYQSNKASNATTANTAYSAVGVIPVGADAVAISYAANKMAAANKNGSGYSVGYLHPMSKTTTAYAAYSSMSNGTATNYYSVSNNALAATATTTSTLSSGGSSNMIAVGLRKKF